MKSVFELGTAWLLTLALAAVFVIGVIGFAVWSNYHLAVPLANSERYVQTCNTQYLTTQKAKIEGYLDAISNNNLEIADPNYASMKPQLQAQNQQSARGIYNALNASQCSHPQIVKDMPELQSFYSQFPTR